TTFHPVPPSAAEGKYETGDIQRVYWTDNFNELRSFNTQDPLGFALDLTLLNIKPNLDLSVPILQKINDSGGIISAGVWQCAYRLKNTGGATTTYSKCSNVVSVINGLPDSTSFRDYVANNGPFPSGAAKSITWQIDGLDEDYDRVEIVVLFRPERTSIPTVDLVYDEPIPAGGTFKFTYSGTETHTPIDLNEFLNTGDTFTHCKTIVSKTNQLLAGNVKNKTFDVDYDARAYRFTGNAVSTIRKAVIVDTQANPTTIIADDVLTGVLSADDWGISETHDAINPDQFTQTSNGYRYQVNGLTIGGTGPNISYSFTTRYFTGDVVAGFNGTAAAPYGTNSRFTNPQPASYTLNNNTFKNNNFYESMKSPYLASAFKGYQHDEVYSFAIRFFDKKGRPGFAKWIADIRMPLIYEENVWNPNGYDYHPITDVNGYTISPGVHAQRIGILEPVFNVTIPTALQEVIGGWEIVRCERTLVDKSVVAAGTLHAATWSSTGGYYNMITPRDFWTSYLSDPYSLAAVAAPNFPATISGHYASFRSPDFTFLQYTGFNANDTIKILGEQTLPSVGYNTWTTGAALSPDEFILTKNYKDIQVLDLVKPLAAGFYIERTLGAGQFVSRGGTATSAISGNPVRNYTDESTGVATTGDDAVFLEWPADYSLDAPTTGGYGRGLYYALYKKPKWSGINYYQSTQYGGNSYSQRSSRKYISCGHFQPVTSISPTTTFTAELCGGDIFTNIWSTQRGIKNWGGAGNKRGQVYWQPVQSILNTEWRYGTFVNKDGIDNTGTGDNDLGENYYIQTTFSAEDNIKVAYPKPAVFTDVQEYDTRVHISGVKINGEYSDS
ncbi:MAG: hypothetical protein NUV65_00070, partial [Candidatus Roizmanbacteria bacterium]|nr:hypothetical protein [Candidatus Roizmanbacteria bacterium]